MPVTEEPGWRTQGGHNTSQPEQLARPGQHCTLVNTTTYQHVLRSSSRFLFERNVHFVPLSHPESDSRLFSFFPDIYLSLQTVLQSCVHLLGQSCRSLQCLGGCSTGHMCPPVPLSPCCLPLSNGCHLTSRVTGLRHKSIMGQQCQSQVIPGQLSQPPSVTQCPVQASSWPSHKITLEGYPWHSYFLMSSRNRDYICL